MTGFADLHEVFDSSLRLPIGGEEWRIPSPNARDGLFIKAFMETALDAAAGKDVTDRWRDLDDDEERDLYRMALSGDVFEKMLDVLDWQQIRYCAMTAMFWIAVSEDAAQRFWASGGRPEAPAPNRAQRRSRSTGAAPATRKRGSTSTTSSRPTSARAGRGSRGATS